MLSVGTTAPDFHASDQYGRSHTLADYVGQWLLIFFYPKDSTPGCTKEARTLQEEYPQFEKLDAAIVGVSADSVVRHERFADNLNLSFTLLSDESKAMIEAYEAWGEKKFMGKKFMGILRISYLIDPAGRIVKAYEKVKPATHATEVLADLEALQKSQK